MEKTNARFMRRVDALGRVVIPKALRDALDVQPGQAAEMYVREGCLVVQSWTPGCVFCGETRDLSDHLGKLVCARCGEQLRRRAAPATLHRRSRPEARGA